MSEPLDTSVLEVRDENPPVTEWIHAFILLRQKDAAPYLMADRISTQPDVIRNGMWGLLDCCEVVQEDIPEKGIVMMRSDSVGLGENKTASAILGKPVFGSVVLFKRVSETKCGDLTIQDYEEMFPELLPSLEELETVKSGRKRDEIIAEFEGKAELGEIIRRSQFLRNKEGSNCSTVEIIRVVTREAFEKLIAPRLKISNRVYWEGFDWDEYQRVYQQRFPYYGATLNSSLGRFDMFRLTDGQEGIWQAGYTLRVPSFSCPEAKLWARIADSDVSRKRTVELQAQLGKRLKMDQPLASYKEDE